jgi:hypothetical protein
MIPDCHETIAVNDVGITSADLRVDVDDSLGCIILWLMPLDGGDAMQVLLSPRPPPSTLILRVVAQLTKLEQEDET